MNKDEQIPTLDGEEYPPLPINLVQQKKDAAKMKSDRYKLDNLATALGSLLAMLAFGAVCLIWQALLAQPAPAPTPEQFTVIAEVSSIRYLGIPWDGYQIGVTVKVVKAERIFSPGQEYELWLPSWNLEGLKEGYTLRLRCNGAAGKDIFCSDEYEVVK